MVWALKLNITSTQVLQLTCVLPLYHSLYQNRYSSGIISAKNMSVTWFGESNLLFLEAQLLNTMSSILKSLIYHVANIFIY